MVLGFGGDSPASLGQPHPKPLLGPRWVVLPSAKDFAAQVLRPDQTESEAASVHRRGFEPRGASPEVQCVLLKTVRHPWLYRRAWGEAGLGVVKSWPHSERAPTDDAHDWSSVTIFAAPFCHLQREASSCDVGHFISLTCGGVSPHFSDVIWCSLKRATVSSLLEVIQMSSLSGFSGNVRASSLCRLHWGETGTVLHQLEDTKTIREHSKP